MTGPSDGGSSVAFSPDGQMALLGDDNGAIRLWDIQPSPDPRTFSGHTHVVAATKLSPAGGATSGIGSALARLVDVVIQDQRAMLTVCAPTPEVAGVTDVTVSLTHLVGGEEILVTLPLPLTGRETAALQANAQVICEVTDALKVYN